MGKTQNFRTACDKVFGTKFSGNIEVEELNFRKYSNCLILNTQETVFEKLVDFLNKNDNLSFEEIYKTTKEEFKYF